MKLFFFDVLKLLPIPIIAGIWVSHYFIQRSYDSMNIIYNTYPSSWDLYTRGFVNSIANHGYITPNDLIIVRFFDGPFLTLLGGLGFVIIFTFFLWTKKSMRKYFSMGIHPLLVLTIKVMVAFILAGIYYLFILYSYIASFNHMSTLLSPEHLRIEGELVFRLFSHVDLLERFFQFSLLLVGILLVGTISLSIFMPDEKLFGLTLFFNPIINIFLYFNSLHLSMIPNETLRITAFFTFHLLMLIWNFSLAYYLLMQIKKKECISFA